MRIRFLPAIAGVLRLWSAVMLAPCLFACSCMSGHSACGQVALGTAVFTGRVLSVSPPFINRFNPASRAQADRVVRFHDQLDSGAPGESLQSFKDTFRELVPALSPDEARQLKAANSRQALLRLFDIMLDHGSYVTLEVKTVFTAGHGDDDVASAKPPVAKKDAKKGAQKDDDDDKAAKAKDDDDFAAGKVTAIRTPSFDCGVEFQVGETYLVYASMDEDTDTVETDTCMGTRRLSDAGIDLPYLSFLKDDPEESAHLDGFVTSSAAARANPPEGGRISAPVPDTLIELKSDDAVRYATSNNEGQFVFDGLSGGSYRIAAYAAEYPDPDRIVVAPSDLTIAPKACARYVVLAQPPRR